MGFKKAERTQITKTILGRLANYQYAEQKPGTMLLFDLKKTPSQLEFEEWIRNDPQSKIHTPKRTYKEGWVFLDHIERPPCPYKNPESHRHNYIKPLIEKGLIEKEELLFTVKKPGQKNRTVFRPKVYRLKRTKAARKQLLDIFKNDISFYNSDYYRETEEAEGKDLKALKSRARMINAAVAKICADGYPNDKAFYEGLFGVIDRLKESLLSNYEKANSLSPDQTEQEYKPKILKKK